MQPPSSPIIQRREGESVIFHTTVRDGDGGLVLKAAIDSLTLTLSSWYADEMTIINGRDAQNVLDAHDGEYFDELQTADDEDGNAFSFNFRFSFRPEDMPFLRADTARIQVEDHVAEFRVTFDDGAKAAAKQIILRISNSRGFAVEATT